MARRVGIDLASVAEVSEMLRRHPQRYVARVFADEEIAECGPDPAALAERFAVKEAVRKLLRAPQAAVPWPAVRTRRTGVRALEVCLDEPAAALARAARLGPIALTVSRAGGYATAVALAQEAS